MNRWTSGSFVVLMILIAFIDVGPVVMCRSWLYSKQKALVVQMVHEGRTIRMLAQAISTLVYILILSKTRTKSHFVLLSRIEPPRSGESPLLLHARVRLVKMDRILAAAGAATMTWAEVGSWSGAVIHP
jgi:hypothetical protein